MANPLNPHAANRDRLGVFFRICAWTLSATIMVLSLSPAELRPVTPVPHDLEHFGIFVLTGLAFGLGYKDRLVRLAILLSVFAALIELAQTLTTDRHARLEDLLVDVGAMCCGVFLATLIRWTIAKMA